VSDTRREYRAGQLIASVAGTDSRAEGMLWKGEVISPTFRHAYSIERGCRGCKAACWWWLRAEPLYTLRQNVHPDRSARLRTRRRTHTERAVLSAEEIYVPNIY
jgi:hypothetical protein